MVNNQQFGVLMLDDDAVVTAVVTKAFRQGMPDALVLTARTVAEAQMLISEYKIHFFILDVNLPDGTGIDFLCDLRTICTDACVVVITGTPLPHYREQIATLDVLLFIEKPVNPKEIVGFACQHRDQVFDVKSDHQTEHFAASLSRLSSLDIIQLKCLTSVTQVVEFTAGQRSGRIYFDRGEVVHAETGGTIGEDALAQILSWRGGKVVEVTNAPERTRTIWTSWQALLLQLAQHIDETNTRTP